jgi:hypothetical protein
MKDLYTTLVIKTDRLAIHPREVAINGITHEVVTSSVGHLAAAFDIAEEYIKNSAEDLRERAITDEDVDAEMNFAEETLQKMQSHKEYGYAE